MSTDDSVIMDTGHPYFFGVPVLALRDHTLRDHNACSVVTTTFGHSFPWQQAISSLKAWSWSLSLAAPPPSPSWLFETGADPAAPTGATSDVEFSHLTAAAELGGWSDIAWPLSFGRNGERGGDFPGELRASFLMKFRVSASMVRAKLSLAMVFHFRHEDRPSQYSCSPAASEVDCFQSFINSHINLLSLASLSVVERWDHLSYLIDF